MKRLYEPLDNVDKMKDSGNIQNSAQIRFQLLDVPCVRGGPAQPLTLRCQAPSLTTVAAAQPWCAAQGIEQQPSMAAF
eukprot:3151744-Prymnesium_polylepis.1